MLKVIRMAGKPEFFDAVLAYMKRESINQRELAERMGVTQPTVSRMLGKKVDPSVDTLDKLASVMNREVAELLYLYLGRKLPDVYEMVGRVNALSDERRAQAVNFALFLFQEQKHDEEREQPINGQAEKNVS